MKVGNIDSEETVLNSTKELLLKFGIKGWNMNDLAVECNMSKRTLYKIIGTKEDLLLELMKKNVRKTVKHVKKSINSDKPFPVLLNNFSDQLIDSFDDFALINIKAIRIEYPRIREMEEQYVKQEKEFLVCFIQKGIDEGCLVDYVEASTIEKTITAIIKYHIQICNNKIEFESEVKEVLKSYIRCIIK